MNLAERIVTPAILSAIFWLLSAGTLVGLGGATARMKVFSRCVFVFVTGTVYSLAWHDVLAHLLGWDRAWLLGLALSGFAAVLLGRRWFAKLSED